MKALIAVACIALAGCAAPEPMNPAQAAILMQMMGNQQAANAAMMQNMQANPVFQRQQQPVYQAPQRSRPISCTTRHVGGTSYTDCY
jgi:hypothetical protein